MSSTEAPAVRTLAEGRFIVRGLLGRGAFGVVYEVEDREASTVLAAKILHREQAWALYRFKTEFRALTEVHHPNLVTLYELHHDARTEQWFFTMDLVAGVDPLKALAIGAIEEGPTAPTEAPSAEGPSAEGWEAMADEPSEAPAGVLRRADPVEIRALFGQIAQGVAALHGAGLLHRDLKPSNIIVDRHGVVRLLDFGLVALLDQAKDERRVVGTRSYMAPELRAGGPASEASDRFAMGVILHQALTGRLPAGDRRDALLERERGALPELCRALLRADPDARPNAREIFAVLGVDDRLAISRREVDPFVGRDEELAALAQVFADSRTAPAFGLVLGTSGVGKSALVRRFLADLERDHEVLIAAGRCFQQEELPLKALDGVVDSLSRALRREGFDRALLDDSLARALVRLFPVMGAALSDSGSEPSVEVEPHELRRRAVEGLTRLIEDLARRRPLIIHIDDLQWGDAESGELLAQVLRRGAPVLVVATCRDEDEDESAFLRGFEEFTREQVRVEVEPLTDYHSRLLATLLVDRHDAAPELSAAIARESGGSPFFIEELVRQHRGEAAPRQTSLVELLRCRLEQLAALERELVELVAVAGQPIPRSLVFAASEVGTGEWQALEALRRMRLVRTRDRGDEPEVESYHDRIRETLVESLTPQRRVGCHCRLAEVMVAAEFGDRGRIARHYVDAGAGQLAVPHAIAAADAASEGLAFERAAEFYRLALAQLGPDQPQRFDLLERRADALVQAGRAAEAAQIYEDIAPARADPRATTLQAAEQWMTSGHHDRGSALLRELMIDAGLSWPASEGRAVAWSMLTLVRLRVGGVRFEAEAEAGVDAQRQLELCFAANRGLAAHDFARALYYNVEAARRCLRGGDAYTAARTLIQAGGYLRAVGLGIGERLSAEGRRLAALVGDDPYLRGLLDLNDGYPQLSLGQLASASKLFDRALHAFEDQCRGTAWEVAMVRAMQSDALYTMGEFARAGGYARASYERARSLGDAQAAIGGGLFYGAALIATGNTTRARELIAEAVDHIDDDALYSYPRGSATQFLCMCDLYEGRRAPALERFNADWAAFRRSGLYWSAMMRSRMLVVRGAIFASLLDVAEADDESSRCREIGRCVRAMRNTKQAWVDAEALRLEAVVAARGDDRDRAREGLEQAEALFEAESFHTRALMCRANRARVDEDASALERTCAELSEAGVAEPLRWLAAYAPGFG